jgi:hypothetical protein
MFCSSSSPAYGVSYVNAVVQANSRRTDTFLKWLEVNSPGVLAGVMSERCHLNDFGLIQRASRLQQAVLSEL